MAAKPLADWDGPSLRAGDEACADCDGDGYHEDGHQVDVDDFEPALCERCGGSGIEPEGDDDE